MPSSHSPRARRSGFVSIAAMVLAMVVMVASGLVGSAPRATAAPPGFHPLGSSETIFHYGVKDTFGPNTVAMGPDGRAWATMGLSSRLVAFDGVGHRTTYDIPTASSSPFGLTQGPDNRMWFTEFTGNKIGAADMGGTITEYPLADTGASPSNITAGPDGALWFTEATGNKIGRITTAGTIVTFPVPTPAPNLSGITSGPDGALWFTETDGNKIGRMTTSGAVTEYSVPTAASSPVNIVTGPDGALWFTEFQASKLGRITTSGAVTEHSMPASSGPDGIAQNGQQLIVTLQIDDAVVEVDTSGSIRHTIELGGGEPSTAIAAPDGSMWIALTAADRVAHVVHRTPPFEVLDLDLPNYPVDIIAGPDHLMWFATDKRIGRVNADGTVTYFDVPGSDVNLNHITNGPDGTVWFTDQGRDRVGYMTTSGAFTDFDVGSGSEPEGITTGPDGNLWVALAGSNAIASITPSGIVTPFAMPIASSEPSGITVGHDGRIWFTLTGGDRIGAMTTAGAIETYPLPTTGSEPQAIVMGPQDRQWYAAFEAQAIGSVTNSGTVSQQGTDFLTSTVAEGADHDLWTGYFLAQKVGWRAANGDFTDIGYLQGTNQAITRGHDQAIWFVSSLNKKWAQIVRLPLDSAITLTGQVTPTAAPGSSVSGSFTVTNDGRNDAGEPVITLTPSNGETLRSVTGPTGWACTTPTGVAGGALTCSATQVPVADGQLSFSFTAGIAGTAGGTTQTVTVAMSATTPLSPKVPSTVLSTSVTGTSTTTTPMTSTTSPPDTTPVVLPVFTG